MKKTILVIVGFLFFIFLFPDAQAQFQKVISFPNDSRGFKIVSNTDGGYFMLGSIEDGPYVSNISILVMKLDSSGNVDWAKRYGYPGYFESLVDVISNNDSTNTLLMDFSDGDGTPVGTSLIKINNSGDTVWTRNYESSPFCSGIRIRHTMNNGYMIIGKSTNVAQWLLVTDSSGNILWSRTYGFTTDFGRWDIAQTGDGSFIAMGNTAIGTEVFLVLTKFDSSGNLRWCRGMTDSLLFSNETMIAIDNELLIAGAKRLDSTSNDNDAFLMKLDTSGVVQWVKTYGESNVDRFLSVNLTSDSSLLLSGNTMSFSGSPYDWYLVKTNLNGDTIFTRFVSYGKYDGLPDLGNNDEIMWSGFYYDTASKVMVSVLDSNSMFDCNVFNTSSVVDSINNFEAIGLIPSMSSAIQTVFPAISYFTVVPSGNIDLCGIFTSVSFDGLNNILLSPNPVSSLLKIETTQHIDHIELFSLFGEKVPAVVDCCPSAKSDPSFGGWTVDCRLLPPGIYILQASNGEKVWRGKFIKE